MEQMIVAMACFSELLVEYHILNNSWDVWDSEKQRMVFNMHDLLEDAYLFENRNDPFVCCKFDNLYAQGVRTARATKRYNSN